MVWKTFKPIPSGCWGRIVFLSYRNKSIKELVSIHSVRTVWTPIDNPSIWPPHFLDFFSNPSFLKTLLDVITPMKYGVNIKINLWGQSYFFIFRRLQNNITCFFVGNTFISNTPGWDLIKNNNIFWYQKDLKEK